MSFSNLIGLWALAALIPFILIYLIRPKPLDKIIPSLMFILKEQQTTKQFSFLQKLMQNLLFILQLAALTGLAIAIAAPYINIPYSVSVDHTVIILDVSASMQAKSGAGTRMDRAIAEAKNSLDGRISIIMAENAPVVILEDGRKDEALSLLNKMSPKATTTNLGDALLMADEILAGKQGRVLVISDFIATEGPDLLVAKRAITSKGNAVNFIDLSSEAANVGIVELQVEKSETIATIKSYYNEEKTVSVKLTKDSSSLDKQSLKLLPNSKEKITFPTPTGVSKIELDIDDDLALDNYAYISAPEKKTVSVLLITNQKQGSVEAALKASKEISLEIREPPTTNAYNIEQEIVVLDHVDKELFVLADFTDLKHYVEKGGNIIIAAQDSLNEFNSNDLKEMLPIEIWGKNESRTAVCVDAINQFTKQFEENRCFANTERYFNGRLKDSAVKIASSEDDFPIIAFDEKKGGKVIYYGIFDDFSDFRTLTSYPIFWNDMISFLAKAEDIKDYNYKTGEVLAVKEQTVKKPYGSIKTEKVILDEAGLYELEDRKIAVNLVNEQESDIGREAEIVKQDKQKFSSEKAKESKEFSFSLPLLIFAFAIILFELIYIKIRGDI